MSRRAYSQFHIHSTIKENQWIASWKTFRTWRLQRETDRIVRVGEWVKSKFADWKWEEAM